MQTHTFIAESATEAVERIRAELGPSAIVVSVRKLPRNGLSRLLGKEQIEVVAGVEEPKRQETRTPLAELQSEMRALKHQLAALRLPTLPPPPPPPPPITYRAEMLGNPGWEGLLVETGIMPAFCAGVLEGIATEKRACGTPEVELLKKALRGKWRGQPARQEAAVHLFVGVPGCGKSTVLCKMLAQTSLVERQPATVYHLDSHMANASSQTPIFAEIIGAQFERTFPQSFERREESVFVDLPGVAMGSAKGLSSLREIIPLFGVPEVHLVLNAAYESSHLLAQTAFFAELGITDLIITHLDEEPRWGKIWNLILGKAPEIRYFSAGQNVPGDLHIATPDLLLKRQFLEK